MPRLMPTLVIINNTAAKARRAWPIIKRQFDQAHIHYDLHETKAAGDATIATRKALKGGVNSIAVVGGDGTLSEVTEGFFEFDNNIDALTTTLERIRGSRLVAPMEWLENPIFVVPATARIRCWVSGCSSE